MTVTATRTGSEAELKPGPSTPTEPVTDLRFRAMGTSCQILVCGGPSGLAEGLRRRVEDLDQRWSRFRPDSEISRLNAGAGSFYPVSEETAMLVRRGVQGWARTSGRFDPTVLGAVIRAGYDRDLDEVLAAPGAGSSHLQPGCAGISVRDGGVLLPAGTGFDSGGLGKGLAADLVAAEAMRAGAGSACVNLGGDLRAIGPGPNGDGWTTAVEHPHRTRPLARIGMTDGGLATSTTLLRCWSVEGQEQHHLIDPATGRPAAGRIQFVTVIAQEGWLAEVLAKAVILDPGSQPLSLLGPAHAEGLAVMSDGSVSSTPGLTRFLGGAELPDRL